MIVEVRPGLSQSDVVTSMSPTYSYSKAGIVPAEIINALAISTYEEGGVVKVVVSKITTFSPTDIQTDLLAL